MTSGAPPDPLAPCFADAARVELAHGAGGRTMAKLIERLFRRAFASPLLDRGNDQAVFDAPRGRLAMSTDSFVVSPPFFPGGNIGSLAVHGTVNDVAMSGARPLYLSAGFILEATPGLDLGIPLETPAPRGVVRETRRRALRCTPSRRWLLFPRHQTTLDSSGVGPLLR